MIECTERRVVWRSRTAGDEDGIILTIKAPADAYISFKTEPCSFKVSLGDINVKPITFKAGGLGQEVSIRRLPDAEPPREVRFSWVDEEPPKGEAAYYIKVTQVDGSVAFSSPFYVKAM